MTEASEKKERIILAVDDDVEVLKALGKTFTTILPGYFFFSAVSGNEGLNKLKSKNPDVVVVDVRLGKESGMDLVKEFQVHAQEKWNRCPRFVVITAYKDDKVMKEALETDKVDRFLIKPFVSGEVEEAVLESLERFTEDEYEEKRKAVQEEHERKMKAITEEYEKAMKAITFARSYMKTVKEKAMAHQKMLRERKEKRANEAPSS